MNGEEFGDLTPQPPLHEWRGGEEFDARNCGRLDSGGDDFDFSFWGVDGLSS